MHALELVTVGILAGIVGGVFGVGGGMILVPALIYLFHLTQHQAQGASLAAMLPPVALIGVYHYWKAGNLQIGVAGWVALGLVIGTTIGAYYVQPVSGVLLRKLFGGLMLIASIKMLAS